ncbi:zinc finger MYM-type protein 1-like, partial [Aphis craccivora]
MVRIIKYMFLLSNKLFQLYVPNIVPFETKISNDPALYAKLTNISEEYRQILATMGPCQPTPLELPGKKFPYTNNRSFHEHYYYKTVNNIKVKRLWLSYSPINNKMYCTSCKLFGTPEAQKQPLATEGSNNWSMIMEKIKLHENKSCHLTAEINRGMYNSCQRVDKELQIHKNQLYLLFLEHLRGHNEKLTSDNQGNFLELVHLLGKYNPYLSCHLQKISENAQKNRLTFLSNDSQNKMLQILSDMVREQILSEIKKSGMFAVIIHTTTDLSKLEQLAFVIRYVTYNGIIQERLVALEVARDASGRGLFNLFSDICAKYQLEWEKELIAQAYDGASTMQGEYQGLRTHIQLQNPRAVYIWCFAHILNLVIVDVCETSIDIKIFISNIQALTTFMSARKRTADFVEAQLLLYPNMRVQRMKNLSTTRWTSHDRAINVVFLKYLAVIETLENLTKSPDTNTSCQAK